MLPEFSDNLMAKELINAARENDSKKFRLLIEQDPEDLRKIVNKKYNENGDTFLHWAKYQYLLNAAYQSMHNTNCKVVATPESQIWLTRQEQNGIHYKNTVGADHLVDFYREILDNYQYIIGKLLELGAKQSPTNNQGRNADEFAKSQTIEDVNKQTKRHPETGLKAKSFIASVNLDQAPPPSIHHTNSRALSAKTRMAKQ